MDEYMFYLECRDNFLKVILESITPRCSEKIQRNDRGREKIADILYPLCKTKDTERFKRLLLSYKTYLNELIPFLFNKVKQN